MSDIKINRFARIFDKAIIVMISFCLLSFLVVSFTYLVNHPEYLKPVEFLYLLPVGVLLVIEIFLILKSLSFKYFLVLWSVVFAVLSILVIVWLNSPPQGDGGGIFKEALYLSQGGDFALDESNYYFTCSWLMWTVYLEKILIDFFGVGYGFFKVFGSICLLGSGLIGYIIGRKIFGECIAKIFFGLFVLFSPITLCVSHFSHQHMAFFLLMLSIYLMMSDSWYKWALAGLTCGLMNDFRPWGILLLLTAIVLFIYRLFTKSGKVWYRLLLLALFLAVYKLSGFCIDQILIAAGYYDSQALGGSMLWIKLDRGIDPNMADFSKYANKYAVAHSTTNSEYVDLKNKLYKNHLIELIKTPSTYVFVANKMVRMFGEVDYWFENCFANKLSVLDYPYRLLYFLNWFQYIYILVFAFIGKLRNKSDNTVNILSIFTIGYFSAHLFIEAFSSYRLCIYPLLLMYAAVGIDKVSKKLDSRFSLALRKDRS